MALTEETVIDRIELDELGHLLIRRATFILRDGVRLPSPTFHRILYPPGADLTAEDARVRAIAAAAWTPDLIRAAVHRVHALHERIPL